MKALAFSLIVLSFSSVAMADDFFCEMKVGENTAKMVAEYRVRLAYVSLNQFSCMGRVVPGTRNVEVTIDDHETASTAVSLGLPNVHAALELVNGELVECVCGLE